LDDDGLKLGLHVILVTHGNEAAAAPFARLHCIQEKRITHGMANAATRATSSNEISTA